MRAGVGSALIADQQGVYVFVVEATPTTCASIGCAIVVSTTAMTIASRGRSTKIAESIDQPCRSGCGSWLARTAMPGRTACSLLEAATEGARLRFRPVMMTSLAFILGLLPLVVATGASQLARRNVGTPVFGGMILASCVGIFVIPPLYVAFQAKI
jgi:hypothetical protein